MFDVLPRPDFVAELEQLHHARVSRGPRVLSKMKSPISSPSACPAFSS
jgi:hypothetical protein